MKQIINNTKTIAIALVTILAIGATSPVFAAPKAEDPVELKFLGNVKNQPVFQLSLNNKANAEYYVIVKDKNNSVLYSETVKGENIVRKYRLNSDELEVSGITFEVTEKKSNETSVYEVNTNVRTINEVSISKL